MKILVCPPQHYGINYEINAWMSVECAADTALAQQQWQALTKTITQCHAELAQVEAVKNLPDMVFTANAALVYKDKAYLARFKCPERQPEHGYFQQWFKTNTDLTIVHEPDNYFAEDGQYVGPSFEGAGDALFIGDCLFAGVGFRSGAEIYPTICAALNISEHIICELVNPYFYHLDTCFCPLNDKQAIWFPDAFSPESQQRMQQHGELFAIPEEEARHFACNAVVLDNDVIIPSGCQQTEEILSGLGFSVHQCDMTEFIKSGGACKCLTLRLD